MGRALAAVVLAGACGRVAFDPLPVASDSSIGDGSGDAPQGGVTWAKSFVAQVNAVLGTNDMFTASAANAGDAIVIHLFCQSTTMPTGVTVSHFGPAPWGFAEIIPITGMGGGNFWAAAVSVIAPDTSQTMFSVDWFGTPGCNFLDEIGDDFTGNDQNGDLATFDARVGNSTVGECTASLTTLNSGDAVWAACTASCVAAVGPGYTKAGDDGHCDWSEWRSTTDPANTVETPTFTTTAQTLFVMTATTIKPR